MGRWLVSALLFISVAAVAQNAPPNDATPFISVPGPVVVLNHVRVIDGTGSPAKENQTILISGGKIAAIGDFGTLALPGQAQQLDRTGYTVIPGIVGMHDHLYYTNSYSVQLAKGEIDEPGVAIVELPYSAPRLYLAAGVTTMRTTGSLEPYTDIKIKERIDAGLMPGPKIDLTAPYLEGKPTFFAQMHELTGVDDAKRMVDYWADEGMTSYKAYMNITRDELGTVDQGGTRASSEADRTPMFRDLARSDCARHRRLRARSGLYRHGICWRQEARRMCARIEELDEYGRVRSQGTVADPGFGLASCRRNLDVAGVRGGYAAPSKVAAAGA